ncbi:MAG: endonuclease [Flavobacteriales bacterium]|nr:endonuclease [Flavobacteriales bacterium]
MKKYTLFLSLIGFYAFAFGQISVSTTSLVFDETFTKDSTEKTVLITNHFSVYVDLEVGIYQSDFSVNESTFSLAPNNSKTITVKFKPRHNINYNTELVIYETSKVQVFGGLAVDVRGTGKYADTYYSSTQNLFEEDLKQELKSILAKNYTNLGYNGARDVMYGNIDNHGGQVECIYTGRKATFNTRSGATSNNFNCEHTWPQSLFNQTEPERADIHHLFPTDETANGKRGNYPFAVVVNPSWTDGGSKQSGSIFEPRDAHKGDAARALFYFATRYQNYSGFLTDQETLLREWATRFPPAQNAIDRNNAVFGYQKNRNPYIDHPEFLERIHSISTTSVAPQITEMSISTNDEIIMENAKGKTLTYQFSITNLGNQNITFTAITPSNNQIAVDNGSFVITPGESKIVTLTFNLVSDFLAANLHLKNDALDLNIPVKLYGAANVSNLLESNMQLVQKTGSIMVKNAQKAQFNLYDLTGRELFFTEIQSDFAEIALSMLTKGFYFVQVVDLKGNSIVKKIYLE